MPSDAAAELEAVAHGMRQPGVRIRVPRPTLAFGRLDALRPGFAEAAEAAGRLGFEPVVRAPGGHAAAYHPGCLLVEEFQREPRAIDGLQERFRARGKLFAAALRSLGVDANVGAVPGEYCPGRYTVNARHEVKLVGTAQRIVRDGWLFADVVTVRGTPALRTVLKTVYALLELPMDPHTVAGVADEVPSITVRQVRDTLEAAYAPSARLSPSSRAPASPRCPQALPVRPRREG